MLISNRTYTTNYRTDNFIEANTKTADQEYEIIVKNPYLPYSSGMDIILISTNDIYDKIVEILCKSKLIDKIFIVREENTFCIWAALKKYDRSDRYALYNQELEVIKYFSPVEFHFDFHLAEADDVIELQDSGARIIYPKH